MTLVMGFATRAFALLAADTRVRWNPLDDAAADLTAPDYASQDNFLKIFPWPAGWATSAPRPSWARGIRDAIAEQRDLDGAVHAMQRFAATEMPDLTRRAPRLVEQIVEHQGTFLMAATARGGFGGAVLDWSGERGVVSVDGLPCMAKLPVGVDPDALQTLLQAYESDLAGLENQRFSPIVLRRTAELFREVYHLAGPEGSVSAQVEIGIVQRSLTPGHLVHGHLGPLPYEALLNASGRELVTV